MNPRSELCESPGEEIANVITHGIGTLLGVGATVLMVVLAIPAGPWHVAGVLVFGVSLVLLYLVSTLYHWVTREPWKGRFQKLDHVFIFILIAGSYTPWLLVNLRGPWGWTLFAVIWGIAVVGIVLKTCFFEQSEKISLALYIGMGWIAAFTGRPLLEAVGVEGILWLVGGGVLYTVGVVFYLQEKLRYAHLVWHLFVLAGSAAHVVAVIVGVIPAEVQEAGMAPSPIQ